MINFYCYICGSGILTGSIQIEKKANESISLKVPALQD